MLHQILKAHWGTCVNVLVVILERSETPVVLEANQSWQPEIENIH
jgi:hypothetical protein